MDVTRTFRGRTGGLPLPALSARGGAGADAGVVDQRIHMGAVFRGVVLTHGVSPVVAVVGVAKLAVGVLAFFRFCIATSRACRRLRVRLMVFGKSAGEPIAGHIIHAPPRMG